MTRLEDYDVTNPMTGKVISTTRLTPADSDVEIRDIVLEVEQESFTFKTGQSVGVLAPGAEEYGSDHHFRLYSIAGKGENDNQFRICVKRCFYIDEFNGERYAGIASNYLCDRVAGDEILMAGPYGMAFSIPEEKDAGLLMIGLGTGIAPFRAMVRNLFESEGAWKGKVRLFYGAKSGLELAYMNDEKNDFQHYYDKETFKAFEAVSPKPYFDEPIALDEALKQNSDEVWSMLRDPDTHVYVAGLEKIRGQLDKAFGEMAGSDEKWTRRLAELKAGGRWQEVLY